ncbi:hypothetical protein [Mesorhizobium montanum]|uniref:hypothetical protein n=1 Tax=Mesorhizobium montanum TaxID=3072323 RepID=UPI002A2455C7|nr:hypothetical protein [Mesorhizobium sp. MSK_1335]
MIDEDKDPEIWPATAGYARWLHEQFCKRLPEEVRMHDGIGHRGEPGIDSGFIAAVIRISAVRGLTMGRKSEIV